MVTAFTEVWTAVVSFIVGMFGDMTSIFYDSTDGLTFIGTFAVIMAGVAMMLLVFNLIRSFFPARG